MAKTPIACQALLLIAYTLAASLKQNSRVIKKRKMIVVGGGLAGIQLARRSDDKLFDILLVEKCVKNEWFASCYPLLRIHYNVGSYY